jgi:hypothetical protein
MLASSGVTHEPPAFQLLEVVKPSSIPARPASRIAWPMVCTDSGLINAGPAGTIPCGSRAPHSKMNALLIPLAFHSSSSQPN